MNRFSDKTVLVAGGTSGIGLAVARAFANEGARVVITGRDAQALSVAAAQVGANAIALRNDASQASEATALLATLRERQITLDAAFLNAGTARFAPFGDVTETFWDQLFDVNVKGAYFQLQALVPLFNQCAAVVLNGSINAHIGMPNSSVYAASKAALTLWPRRSRPNCCRAACG